MAAKGKTVLDLGCKDCARAESYGLNMSKTYIGLDINKKFLFHAIEKSFDVIKYDLEVGNLPFKDKIFDCVLAIDILEHLYSHIEIVREVYRVLKADGLIIVSVPSEHSPWIYEDYTHKRAYTENAIKNLLTDNGFEISSIRKQRNCMGFSKKTITRDLIRFFRYKLVKLLSGIDLSVDGYFVIAERK